MDFPHAAARQFRQQLLQIDLAPGTGQHQHFGAPLGQGRRLGRIVDGTSDQHRPSVQDARFQRYLQPAVHHHAQGLARRVHLAHREPGIVVAHRADAGEDGAGAGAPPMAVAPGLGAGDPLAAAVIERRLTVQAGGQLEAQPGPAAGHARDEADVELARLGRQGTDGSGDAGGTQPGQPLARHLRIGVFHGGHHPRHAGLDEGVGAGGRAAVVAAGFQGDVGGGAARALPGLAQGMHFRMGLAGALVPALAQHRTVAHDDAADARVGRGGEQAALGQLQRAGHEGIVGGGEGVVEHGGAAAARHALETRRGRGFFTSRMASRNSSTSSKLRYTEAKRT